MTFPGTYNINYYYGDTFEFLVSPKDSNGAAFSLEDFGAVRFNLAPSRGAIAAEQISCYAAITQDKRSVLCAITPENSLELNPAQQYVYDVEVVSQRSPYDKVYTLVTGNVNITPHVSLPIVAGPGEIPNNPTNLVITQVGSSFITAEWTPPSEGVPVTGYKVAVVPYTTDQAVLEAALDSPQDTLGASSTSYTFFGLSENTDYSLIVLAVGSEGDALRSSLLTNTSPQKTSDDPNTQEPDFFVTNNGNIEYLIDGVPNEGITLIRGESYIFSINAPGHPFWIQTTGTGYDANNVYNEGITNNGTDSGLLNWIVSESTPDFLYYQCQNHVDMKGIISIVDGGAS